MKRLDRFSQGLADAQQERECFDCDQCGAEIYPGDSYYYFEGERLCSTPCLIEATHTEERTAGEE